MAADDLGMQGPGHRQPCCPESSRPTHCGLVTPHGIMHFIGSGNGLLPDSTKQIPESMFIYSLLESCAIHLKATPLEMLMEVIPTTNLKIAHLKSKPHIPGDKAARILAFILCNL